MRPYSSGQQIENLGEYASAAVDKDVPPIQQYTDGTVPRATLPAKWWNWFTGKFTKNISQTSLAFEDLYGELLDLFTRSETAPGVSGAVTPQVHSVLTRLFYANPDIAQRLVSANLLIDVTKARVDKFFVDTADRTITFPNTSALGDVAYKHAEILNISAGVVNIVFSEAGLSTIVLPPQGMVFVFCVKKADTHYTWRHTWNASSTATANRAIIRDSAARAQVAAPSAAADIARKAEVDAEAALARVASNLTSGLIPPARYLNSDILAKVKEVDGAGSGLDAEFLSGVALSRFIFGAGESGSTVVTDADTISKSGFYIVATPWTGAPSSNDYSLIHVGNVSAGYHVQIASTRNAVPISYIRSGTNMAWGAWGKLWSGHNDGSGSGLDTDLVRATTPGARGLDYLAAAAVANIAALLLPDLKTVDGAGSGLDADTVDGIDSTRTVFGDNITAVSSADDADLITKAGFYRVAAGASAHTWDIARTCPLIHVPFSTSTEYGFQIGIDYVSGIMYARKKSTTWSPWSKVWSEVSDGSGSGLDADMVDGLSPITGISNISGFKPGVADLNALDGNGVFFSTVSVPANGPHPNYFSGLQWYVNGDSSWKCQLGRSNGGDAVSIYIRLQITGTWGSWYKLWNAANDGSGSGLDTDLVRGTTPGAGGLSLLALSALGTNWLSTLATILNTGWPTAFSAALGDYVRTNYLNRASQATMAAQLLLDLKTVDGPASGLDADTVHSQPGSEVLSNGAGLYSTVSRGSWWSAYTASSATNIWVKVLTIDTTGLSYSNTGVELTVRMRYITSRYLIHTVTQNLGSSPSLQTFAVIPVNRADNAYDPNTAARVLQIGNVFELWVRNLQYSGVGVRLDTVSHSISVMATLTKHTDVYQTDDPTGAAPIVLLDPRYKTWNSGNDGAGSGMDADTVDGIDSTRVVFGDDSLATITKTSGSCHDISKGGFYRVTTAVTDKPPDSPVDYDILCIPHSSLYTTLMAVGITPGGLQGSLWVKTKSNEVWGSWYKLWNAANDGSGSGLDTDLVRATTPGAGGLSLLALATLGSGWTTALAVAVGTQARTYLTKDTQATMAAQLLLDLKTVDGAGSGLDADTVDSYDVTTVGDGIKVKHGYIHSASMTEADIFNTMSPAIPNITDWVGVWGFFGTAAVVTRAERISSTVIRLHYRNTAAGIVSIDIDEGSAASLSNISISW